MPMTAAQRQWLEDSTCARIAPSAIHGVGVFATRDLAAGTDPFPGIKRRHRLIRLSPAEVGGLSPAARSMVQDFCLPYEEDGLYYVPDTGVASFDMSFYLNASAAPNVEPVHGRGTTLCCFQTTRPVKAGEELTFRYSTPTTDSSL